MIADLKAFIFSKTPTFQAKKQGIYKNYIHAVVDKLGSIPVNNETYDILIMSNGFAPGTNLIVS